MIDTSRRNLSNFVDLSSGGSAAPIAWDTSSELVTPKKASGKRGRSKTSDVSGEVENLRRIVALQDQNLKLLRQVKQLGGGNEQDIEQNEETD